MIRYIVLIFLHVIFFTTACSQRNDKESVASVNRIKSDLDYITSTDKSRNYINIAALNKVADHIYSEFSKHCDTVFYQAFMVNGIEYKNVIGSLGITNEERLIVGAHYDVAGNQTGADDNASGVAGLLELSRLLKSKKLNQQIDFIAFTLEEPPFFRTKSMGSYIHAKFLADNSIDIEGMICLDMIGYFNDKKNSQKYPLPLLKIFYGSKGNFITVVQKFKNGKFGRRTKRLMKKQKIISTKSFRAPAKVPGIDFSDHLNYWRFGYSAVLITNSSFYRNPNYHLPTDTVNILDIDKMSKVIDELYYTILDLQ